jgi:hypothetical protein
VQLYCSDGVRAFTSSRTCLFHSTERTLNPLFLISTFSKFTVLSFVSFVSSLFSFSLHVLLLRKVAESESKLRHVRPSVFPCGTVRLPFGGLSLNFIFDHFSEICRHNSSCIEI